MDTKMLKNRKYIGFSVISIIMIVFLVYMGPMDGFKHGFYAEEIDFNQIAEQDWYDTIDLSNGYQMFFSPVKNHFAGISLFLRNQPEGNSGDLNIEIKDDLGNLIEKMTVDLRDVHESNWYKVYLNANLKEGKTYTLNFSVDQCNVVPCLQRVDKDYLPDETLEGDALISYVYSKSTFTFQNKVIISILLFQFGFSCLDCYSTL